MSSRWIEAARQSGEGKAQAVKEKRRQDEHDKNSFRAELPVTEEKVVGFLKCFFPAIESIASDFISAGFTVIKTEPEYLHESYATDKQRGHREQFALAKKVPSYRESKGYAVDTMNVNAVFGKRWMIYCADGKHFADICLWPLVDQKTHYAAVKCVVYSDLGVYAETTAHQDELPSLITHLQHIFSNLIEEDMLRNL